MGDTIQLCAHWYSVFPHVSAKLVYNYSRDEIYIDGDATQLCPN